MLIFNEKKIYEDILKIYNAWIFDQREVKEGEVNIMKAYVLHGIGDIRLEEVEIPSPKKGEVLVKVCATGNDYLDLHPIYGKTPTHFPYIPGHEFSGKVEVIGESVDPGWLHQRVGVCPVLFCGNCSFCQEGRTELCINCGYLGFEKNGGFAEFVIVPEKNLLLLPENVSYEEAAMLEPLTVAIHAVRKMTPKPSDEVVICGMNQLGVLVWLCLKDAGVENIYVIGNDNSQRQMADKAGISSRNYVESTSVDLAEWISRCTHGNGADIMYECTGENKRLIQVVDMMAPMGKVCLVGKPYSDIDLEKETYTRIRKNQLVLEGSWNAFFDGTPEDDWHYALDRLARKIFPLELLRGQNVFNYS